MQQPHLLDRAKYLRNASSPFEAILWRDLSRSQLGGFKFRRQHVIGHCIVDFFCPQKGLIVEVDGDTHDAARDAVRDDINQHRGFVTMRFTNADVGKNLDVVLSLLLDRLTALPDRWPHPNPASGSDHLADGPLPVAPEGEGKRC